MKEEILNQKSKNIEKQKTGKPINYAKIALRGLRGAFKPRNAHVCVDGKEFDFTFVK